MIADTPPRERSNFRVDIQALRGLAILLVLFYHAKLGFFKAGHLGVDIFFVISGYLITRIILKDIQLGTFSFCAFYFRRAKRLLPAAYVVFLATVVASSVLLTSLEMRDFVMQLIGAVTFTGNFALWMQTGYFEGAAHLKPLLHVWSLAIEEQYYLLLPAALMFVPRRHWVTGTVLLLVSSLLLCFILAPLKPGATFYLLPTRGWELAIGSLGALALDGSKMGLGLSRLFWPAILALFLIPVTPIGTHNPGIDALIVCIATLVVILRRHPAFNDGIFARTLSEVGDISYSLYLVHWPLFAFANNAYVTEVPVDVRIGLLATSFLLGYLLYKFVELPVRRSNIKLSRKTLGAAVATSLGIITLMLGVARAYQPEPTYAQVRRANHGFGAACEYADKFTPKAECRNSAEPAILVWGDSFAMHLVPGIGSSADVGVVQATKTVCGPLVGMAAFDTGDYPRSAAQNCLRFNTSVLDYLSKTPSIEVVVLSSPFAQYLDSAAWGGRGFRTLQAQNGKLVEHDPNIEDALKGMRETVSKIRALGKRVVVVAPPPTSNFDIGGCLERKATGKLILGAAPDCQILVSTYHRQQALVLDFLAKLPHEAQVNVVRFDEFLCSKRTCLTELEGAFIYRDWSHFTHEGSRIVAARMGLMDRLYSSAR